LANPDLVGNRFHNCPVGWTCQIINTNMAKAAFGDSGIEDFIHGSGETLAASIGAAFENEEACLRLLRIQRVLLRRLCLIHSLLKTQQLLI